MADEAPPPYQETQQDNQDNDALKGDGEATATQQQKEKPPPNEPEGEFGEPLKRVMWIGGILLFYCILAFWLPVYYMDTWLNICAVHAEAVSPTDPVEQAATEDACKLVKDDFFPDHAQYAAGYSLETIGIALAAVGVILAYFGVKSGNLLYRQIAAVLLGLGGLMAIVGVILIIAIPEDPEEAVLAGYIVLFVEVAIPATVAILLACDVWNPSLLNLERNRMLYCTSIIFIIFGLMGGILYAYIANYEVDGCVLLCENAFKSEYGCIAAGYLLLAIMSVIRILIFEGKIQIENPASQVTAKLLVSVLLIISGFVCAVGYWAYVDAYWDGVTGSNVDDQDKCYYIGLSLFILGIAVVNALDMGLVQHWKACQAAQAAANATPGAATAAT